MLTIVIQHYLKSSGAMMEADLYLYMGFPANWRKIVTYNPSFDRQLLQFSYSNGFKERLRLNIHL